MVASLTMSLFLREGLWWWEGGAVVVGSKASHALTARAPTMEKIEIIVMSRCLERGMSMRRRMVTSPEAMSGLAIPGQSDQGRTTLGFGSQAVWRPKQRPVPTMRMVEGERAD